MSSYGFSSIYFLAAVLSSTLFGCILLPVATSEIRNLTNLAKQSGKTLLQGFDELMIFGRSPLGRAAGYGLGVALPAYFAGEEALKGNYKQAGRELLNIPTLGFGLPESWVGSNKTDLIKHAKEKGLDVFFFQLQLSQLFQYH